MNGTGQPSAAVSAAQAATPAVQPVSVATQPSNPYQGASLTASTSPTAQPMNILALQQLLASTGQGSLLTNGTASGKTYFKNSKSLGSHIIRSFLVKTLSKLSFCNSV